MNKFSIKMPLNCEYMTTARLAVGGLCALAGFDVDSAEDYKVCVTESLLLLKRNGYESAEIEFTVGESLGCKIFGENAVREEENGAEDEISYALLAALIGEVEFQRAEDGRLKAIAFEG